MVDGGELLIVIGLKQIKDRLFAKSGHAAFGINKLHLNGINKIEFVTMKKILNRKMDLGFAIWNLEFGISVLGFGLLDSGISDLEYLTIRVTKPFPCCFNAPWKPSCCPPGALIRLQGGNKKALKGQHEGFEGATNAGKLGILGNTWEELGILEKIWEDLGRLGKIKE